MVIDGQSQAVPHRVFRWLQASQPELAVAWYGEKVQWVYGGHTGYRRYRDSVTHRRGLLSVFGEYLLVLDSVDAREEHAYDTLFHFPPGTATVDEATGACIYTGPGGVGLIIERLGAPDVQPKVISGQTEPTIQGWFSPRYGDCVSSAPVLSFSARVIGAWAGATVVRPFKEVPTELYYVNAVAEGTLSWIIAQGENVDYVTFQKNVLVAGMKTDSPVALFRFSQGRPAYLFIGAGTGVSIEGSLSLTGGWEYLEIVFDANENRVSVNGIWTSLNCDESRWPGGTILMRETYAQAWTYQLIWPPRGGAV